MIVFSTNVLWIINGYIYNVVDYIIIFSIEIKKNVYVASLLDKKNTSSPT